MTLEDDSQFWRAVEELEFQDGGAIASADSYWV